MGFCMRKPTFLGSEQFDTNQAVQAQKMGKDLKFWIYKVEELYHTCSENKDDYQFCSYC